MRARRAAAATALAAAVACGGCGKSGELVVAVQTDMAVGKDIDTITIEVFSAGALKFSRDYSSLGDADAEVKLPATLGLVAEDDPGGPVRVKVSARSGGVQGTVRVLREVVTEAPEDRVALLPVPLHFLCDGSGTVVNAVCDDGSTCIAGFCTPDTVDSSELADYAPEDIYGGGTGFGDGACFDVAPCFAAAAPVNVLSGCVFAAAGDINVALKVSGAGMCSGADCFIALDAGSDAGWTESGGKVQLPRAVCERKEELNIDDVVTAPVTEACPRKTSGLPTCGPWSASGSSP